VRFPACIGYHVSSTGGLAAAWRRAQSLGCTTFQVFSSPPRNWRLPNLDPSRIRAELDQVAALGACSLVFHAPYLVNLASPAEDVRERSIEVVLYGLELSSIANGAPLVVHAGTATDGDLRAALSRLRSSLSEVAGRTPPGARLVFELTAGAGVPIAALPEDVPRLLESASALGDPGICLDTQHLWAAGFDWQVQGAASKLVSELRSLGALEAVCCIHLNDSKSPRGSRIDRHANLGEGFIGLEPLLAFVTQPAISRLPVILETPGSEWLRSKEFQRLKEAAVEPRSNRVVRTRQRSNTKHAR